MSQPSPDPFVQPKPLTAAVFVALPFVGVALGYAVDRWLWPAITGWATDPTLGAAEHLRRTALLVTVVIGGLVAFSVATAAWFWLMSARIYRSAVFPPHGYPVLVKTAVLQGASAIRQARMHLLVGIFCVAVGGYVVWALFDIFPIAALLRAAAA